MSEEKKKKNKIIGISIGILVVLLVVISSTYAYWQITKSQEGSNDIIAACLDIDMQSVDGTFEMNPAWPISDTEGMNLTGYKFRVTNNCPKDVTYVIGMDSLEVSGAKYLSYDSIKVSMDDAPAMIYGLQEDIEHIAEEDDDYVIRDSKKIATSVVKNGQPNEHIVKVWIKSDAPVEEQSRVFSGRMFITGGQKIENDKPLAKLIATGDMSRTENDNVSYRLYDNGDLLIGGTGEIKDYNYTELINELFTKYLTHYNIELTSDEQSIVSDGMLFGYFGLAWYGKSFAIEHASSGAFTTKEDIINYVKNNTEYGEAFESLLEKSAKLRFKNVTIEDGITTIGKLTFNTIPIDNMYISDTVTEFKEESFRGMAVETLRLSENLKTIAYRAFADVSLGSKSLYIPDSVETLSDASIADSNIEVLKLPKNNKFTHLSVSIYSSGKNPKISTIIIPETITSFSSVDGSTEAKITLKFIGPERPIYLTQGGSTEYNLSVFKEVIWNYQGE